MSGSYMFVLGFFFLSFAFGYFLCRKFLKRTELIFAEYLIFGSILGLVTLSLAVYIFSLVIPFYMVALSVGILGVILFLILINKLRVNCVGKDMLIILLSTLFWGIVFLLIIEKTHLHPVGNNFNASPSTYGDLPFHLSVVTNFAYGANFPPLNPIAPYTKLSYHFLPDFISSIVLVLTDNIRFSIIFPGAIMGVLLASSLSLLAFRIYKSLLVSIIAPFLFLLNGGVGFVKFFLNLREYGFDQTVFGIFDRYAHVPNLGVEYPNILAEILMAERAVLLGIPLAATFLFFFYLWIKNRNKNSLFIAGLSLGLLPYVNIYGFLSLGILTFLLFMHDLVTRGLWKHFKKWLVFGAIVLITAFPFFLFILPQMATNQHFIRISIGEWPPFATLKEKIIFWLTNFGIVPVLALLSVIKRGLVSKFGKILLMPLFFLAFLAHIIIFQPYAWDNNRFILYPYIAMSILAAGSLASIFRKKAGYIIAGSLILLVSIISGLLVMIYDPQIAYSLFNKSDFELASFIRKTTNSHDLFLTARNHNHPIPVLAGRRIVLGFGGYLWTHGIYEDKDRTEAMRKIYEAGEDSYNLVRKYGIRYIVLGPWEKYEYPQVNEQGLISRYKLFYNEGNVKIFDTGLSTVQ